MTLAPAPRAGAPVRVEMTKWGDRPHWQFAGSLLGEDEHGEWIGVRAGTRHARPGLAFDSEVDTVTLVPRAGWWLATFHAPGLWCEVYVDIATPARWDGPVLRSVDLDLDVIRLSAGGAYVDDEDEFATHREAFGYPEEVVGEAERACAEVRRSVVDRHPPFDRATPAGWLDRIDG